MSDPTRDAAEFESQVSRAPHLYQVPGTHRLKIVSVREGVSKNPKTLGQPMYTVDFEIVASNNPNIEPGDRVACVQIRQPRDTQGKYWGKIRCIIAAAKNGKETQVKHDHYKKAIDPAQPLTGCMLDVRVSVGADGKSYEQFRPAAGDAPKPSTVVAAPTPASASASASASAREPGSDDELPF